MTKIDKAVLLAAGRGTRMRELTADLPKPMIEVRRQAGVAAYRRRIARRRGPRISDHRRLPRRCGEKFFRRRFALQDRAFNMRLKLVQDGTGRVVDLARNFAGQSPFVLSYGDILVDPANYKRIVDLAGRGRSNRSA